MAAPPISYGRLPINQYQSSSSGGTSTTTTQSSSSSTKSQSSSGNSQVPSMLPSQNQIPEKKEPSFMDKIKSGLGKIKDKIMEFPLWQQIGAALLIVGGAVFLAPKIGSSFNKALESGKDTFKKEPMLAGRRPKKAKRNFLDIKKQMFDARNKFYEAEKYENSRQINLEQMKDRQKDVVGSSPMWLNKAFARLKSGTSEEKQQKVLELENAQRAVKDAQASLSAAKANTSDRKQAFTGKAADYYDAQRELLSKATDARIQRLEKASTDQNLSAKKRARAAELLEEAREISISVSQIPPKPKNPNTYMEEKIGMKKLPVIGVPEGSAEFIDEFRTQTRLQRENRAILPIKSSATRNRAKPPEVETAKVGA